MCGRYHFSVGIMEDIRELTEGTDWKLELGGMDKDIHPGDMAPVITAKGWETGDGADTGSSAACLGLVMQRWGFPVPVGKGLVFNARSESVLEKRMFSESVKRRRAAVPVSWFYEWNTSKEKFTFAREDGRVLFLAGCYSRFEDGDHFVILTTEANSSMIPVHSRMPLILEWGQVRDWILDSGRMGELLGQAPSGLARSCEYEQQTLF